MGKIRESTDKFDEDLATEDYGSRSTNQDVEVSLNFDLENSDTWAQGKVEDAVGEQTLSSGQAEEPSSEKVQI